MRRELPRGSEMGWIPALYWLRSYSPGNFNADLIAGLSLAAFVIPGSLAYASLVWRVFLM